MTEMKIKNKTEKPKIVPAGQGLLMSCGGTTFLIDLHFSETSKDTLEDKMKKLAKKAVTDGKF